MGQLLPVPTDGGRVDLPGGFGLAGSATHNSADTWYVFAAGCPDSRPATWPAGAVVPRHSGNLAPGVG